MSPGEVDVWLAVTLLVMGVTRTKSPAFVLVPQVCAVHHEVSSLWNGKGAEKGRWTIARSSRWRSRK